ncbi:Malate dehydrogenase (plasmid) [Roseomonas mucosa]|uniref:Ldh family oxidoreductase n=1 Tax=Roseomonas mucosa TaxID=207340 RepID=UPI0021FE4645|nr:Ldh family oxidoreductase [Roseomonas mucosa]QDJ12223.1 Malate dehydrogenase [Roseomonas mucosa]
MSMVDQASQGARVDPGRLLDFATAVYEAFGLSPADARLCADTLVQADLWGHGSHGVLRLPWYAARLKSGACNPKASPEIVMDAGALAVVDGHAGMGQVLSAYAADEAVRRAKAHGIGAVGLRNSGHFGTAMYFTRRAAQAGCVAFLSTNASPAMAPWGGREKRVGTNPWSWAAPVGSRPPMVLDIANTGVARGKIYLAKQKGLPIPEGWALDAEGVPTTDPAAAIGGIILPMAAHKGYGIAVMMDVLSGVLTGSAFGNGVVGPYEPEKPSGAGQMMIALNIEAFMPAADFQARMETLVAELKGTPLAQGAEEIFYPGELEGRSEERGRRDGVLLPPDTLADLTRLADAVNLRDRLPF